MLLHTQLTTRCCGTLVESSISYILYILHIWLDTWFQQTQYVYPALFQCWDSVADGGPALKQRWDNVSRLHGHLQVDLAMDQGHEPRDQRNVFPQPFRCHGNIFITPAQ